MRRRTDGSAAAISSNERRLSPRTSGVNLRTTTTPQHGAAPQLGGGGKFNLGSGQLRRRLQPYARIGTPATVVTSFFSFNRKEQVFVQAKWSPKNTARNHEEPRENQDKEDMLGVEDHPQSNSKIRGVIVD
ncbi:unnamed protein product [Cuscuta campestris]|uniref:Uncharacterized protein n=1 Tax=Cuscuta campestris TaxID=132261 RepID=A0A484LJN9_9ASTE|nr:unnamed protein product [Cuscuta campestris]